MEQYKKVYPDLPENSVNPDLPENSLTIFVCKSLARFLKNSKKKQSIIIMSETNISVIIIFFLRSVYQQVLSLLFSAVQP